MPESMYFSFSKNQQLLVPTFSTALTILDHVILLLHQCGPSLIVYYRVPSCVIWCVIGPYQKPATKFSNISFHLLTVRIKHYYAFSTKYHWRRSHRCTDAQVVQNFNILGWGTIRSLDSLCKMRLILLG